MSDEQIFDAQEVIEELELDALREPNEFELFAQELRKLADFYEKCTEPLLLPSNYQLNLWPDPKDLPRISKALGKCEKQVLTDAYFILRKGFGKRVEIEANWAREKVCERVVVGQEKVKEKVPTAFEEREVLKDVVEWHCPRSIVRPKGELQP